MSMRGDTVAYALESSDEWMDLPRSMMNYIFSSVKLCTE